MKNGISKEITLCGKSVKWLSL